MTQCAKIITGFVANVGNVFIRRLQTFSLNFCPRFFVFSVFFVKFLSERLLHLLIDCLVVCVDSGEACSVNMISCIAARQVRAPTPRQLACSRRQSATSPARGRRSAVRGLSTATSTHTTGARRWVPAPSRPTAPAPSKHSKLSLLPSAGRKMSSSLRATGWRSSVADWGGGMSVVCTAGPVVRWGGQWMAA